MTFPQMCCVDECEASTDRFADWAAVTWWDRAHRTAEGTPLSRVPQFEGFLCPAHHDNAAAVIASLEKLYEEFHPRGTDNFGITAQTNALARRITDAEEFKDGHGWIIDLNLPEGGRWVPLTPGPVDERGLIRDLLDGATDRPVDERPWTPIQLVDGMSQAVRDELLDSLTEMQDDVRKYPARMLIIRDDVGDWYAFVSDKRPGCMLATAYRRVPDELTAQFDHWLTAEGPPDE